MSCFLVSDAHISYLLEAARNRLAERHDSFSYYFNGGRTSITCTATQSEMCKFGQILKDANMESYNARYGGTDEAEPFVFIRPERIDIVQVLKACDCFDYQACETGEYYDSEAFAFVNAIRSYAIHRLPGYDEAAWGIEDQIEKVES